MTSGAIESTPSIWEIGLDAGLGYEVLPSISENKLNRSSVLLQEVIEDRYIKLGGMARAFYLTVTPMAQLKTGCCVELTSVPCARNGVWRRCFVPVVTKRRSICEQVSQEESRVGRALR
jgi:hypothetical protein